MSRQRPPVRSLDPGFVPNDSFPSGHVATTIAVYGGIALLLWCLAPRTRSWVWMLVRVPVFVAMSRLYEGAHHVTDVLARVCYTTAWLAVDHRAVPPCRLAGGAHQVLGTSRPRLTSALRFAPTSSHDQAA